MKTLLIISILAIQSCGEPYLIEVLPNDFHNPNVTPEFQVEIDQAIEWFESKGQFIYATNFQYNPNHEGCTDNKVAFDLKIGNGKLQANIINFCFNPNDMSTERLQSVIYHEMFHSVMNCEHSEDFMSVMHAQAFFDDSYWLDNKADLLDSAFEFCTTNKY